MLIVWAGGLSIAVYFQQKAIKILVKANRKLSANFTGSLGDTIKWFKQLEEAFDKLNKISKNSEQVVANLHQHSKTVHEMINSVEKRVTKLETAMRSVINEP